MSSSTIGLGGDLEQRLGCNDTLLDREGPILHSEIRNILNLAETRRATDVHLVAGAPADGEERLACDNLCNELKFGTTKLG